MIPNPYLSHKSKKRSLHSTLHRMHLLTGSVRQLRPPSSSASPATARLLFHVVLDVRWSTLFALDCLASAAGAGDSEGYEYFDYVTD